MVGIVSSICPTLILFFLEYILNKNAMKNIYQDLKSYAYEGLPEFTEDFNPSKEDFPLAALVLFKIGGFKMGDLFNGKDKDNQEVRNRKYEFKLFGESVEDGKGIFHLYLSGADDFLEHREGYRYPHGNLTQAIPLTFKTLSELAQKEQLMIYFDLD